MVLLYETEPLTFLLVVLIRQGYALRGTKSVFVMSCGRDIIQLGYVDMDDMNLYGLMIKRWKVLLKLIWWKWVHRYR